MAANERVTDMESYVLEHFDQAMERGWLRVYCQPVVRTISRQICGMEALARWEDPVAGLLTPDKFIATLERHRRIHELDSYIIRQVCVRLRRSMDLGECIVPVSVNLSRLDFELCDIFDTVDRCIAEFRIPRNYLHIEITESMFADKPELMHAVIQRFRTAGYQVWMDDFGSGYSSLNVLKDFAFDELKIDMAFINTMHLQARMILTSIVDMAKIIGLQTLMEGVETEDQFQFLRDIGCEKVQGYLFGRPQPYDALVADLKQKGILLEQASLREYYDEIGDVNVLSASPFMSVEQRNNLDSARHLNSIPLALLEIRHFHFTVLYCNKAFEEVLHTMEWRSDLVNSDFIGKRFPADEILPERFHLMLDDARSLGRAVLYFISGGDYYEVEAQCVADAQDPFCLLLQIQNLSLNPEHTRTNILDTEMRYVFSIFETIAMIDMANDTYQLLYMGPNDLSAPSTNAREIFRSYSENRIFPEDQNAFLQFYDLETMEERVRQSSRGHIVAYFRCMNRIGQYAWNQYTLLSCRPGMILSLIRRADADVHIIRNQFSALFPSDSAEALNDGRIWKSLIQTDLLNLYWKDHDRRFVGASKGFLDYFGLDSATSIQGKTDEEIGWHVRAEHAVNLENKTIYQGAVIQDAPLQFLVNGTTRSTRNSMAPVYNEYGETIGLVGNIRDGKSAGDPASVIHDPDRVDELTGLRNTRGLAEELAVYCDMYDLRGIDFVRIHLAIEDYDAIVLNYGREYGEKLIASFGRALSRAFGTNSVLSRSRGHQFVILRQYSRPEDISHLTEALRHFAAALNSEDGFSLYLSVGICAFSECNDMFRQEQLADLRQEEDHNRHVSDLSHREQTDTFFQMYDNLPLAFAVYEIKADQGGIVDAFFHYVNARFAMEQGKKPEELIGCSLREIFPKLEQAWYDIAYRAAFLSRASIVERIYFDCMKTHYRLTASQIIRPGFCVFTYQPLDGPYASNSGTDEA